MPIIRNCAACQVPTYIVRSKSRQHIRILLDDKEADVETDDPDVHVAAREEYIVAMHFMFAEPRDCIDEWLLLCRMFSERLDGDE